jgi:hypothetical protein
MQVEKGIMHDNVKERDDKAFLNTAKAKLKDKLTDYLTDGQTFDIYVMNDNRKHLINYIVNKANNLDTNTVNLALIDKKDVNLDEFKN